MLGSSLPGAWTILTTPAAPFHSEPVRVWVINDMITPLQQTWKGGRSDHAHLMDEGTVIQGDSVTSQGPQLRVGKAGV